MPKITVLLVDDHNVVRHGLRVLLGSEPEFEVVGEATSGREALVLAEKLRPDVVVMDLAMPLLNGMEATRQITALCPQTRVIVLSAYEDDTHVEQSLAVSASGYLLKHTASDDLIRAIREVHMGNAYFSPSIAERLREKSCETALSPKHRQTPAEHLSVREAEVLQLVAEGYPNKQIAEELNLSIKTVEKHRQSLMNKLNVHCIADLVHEAVDRGFIEMHSMKSILKV